MNPLLNTILKFCTHCKLYVESFSNFFREMFRLADIGISIKNPVLLS